MIRLANRSTTSSLSILDLYGWPRDHAGQWFSEWFAPANVKHRQGMIADSSRPGVGDELVTRIVLLENVPAVTWPPPAPPDDGCG
jgi:hypothetical protein